MKRTLPRYYRIRGKRGRRRGYWQPGAHARALGFPYVACGPDGHEARAKARELNRQFDAARSQAKRQRSATLPSRNLHHLLGEWCAFNAEELKRESAELSARKRTRAAPHLSADFSADDVPRFTPRGPPIPAAAIMAGADVEW